MVIFWTLLFVIGSPVLGAFILAYLTGRYGWDICDILDWVCSPVVIVVDFLGDILLFTFHPFFLLGEWLHKLGVSRRM